MKDDRVYLLHILECIRRIEEDTAGGKGAFPSSHASRKSLSLDRERIQIPLSYGFCDRSTLATRVSFTTSQSQSTPEVSRMTSATPGP